MTERKRERERRIKIKRKRKRERGVRVAERVILCHWSALMCVPLVA